MIPNQVGQRMILMELIVEQRPVGRGLDPLPPPPQQHGPLARAVASLRRRPAQPRRPVLER